MAKRKEKQQRRSVVLEPDAAGIGSIDSPLEPQTAPSFHEESSLRVRIETRWRATYVATPTRAKAKAL